MVEKVIPTSQNDQVLDDVRQKLELPINNEISLGLNDRLVPVYVVDPRSAPTRGEWGSCFAAVGAGGAGNRSEWAISSASASLYNARNLMIEVYARLFCDGTNGYELLYPTALSGYSASSNYRNFDTRFAVGSPGQPFFGTRNNAAASAGNGCAGPNINPASTGVVCIEVRIGPFYLHTAPGLSLVMRPIADNTPMRGGWDWRIVRTRGSTSG